MRSPVLEQLRRGQRVAWEGPCEISGVGASAAVPHWLVVTEEGQLAFVHGPEGGSLAWTHLAPPPHAPGTILARWVPEHCEFIFRFDRHWDPMVATLRMPGSPAPRLWATLRRHLLPPAREPSPLWYSRFYCRAALRAEPAGAGAGGPESAGEPASPRFIRVFAHEDHLSLSVCCARPAEQISLYGAITLTLPYADLEERAGGRDRRRWGLRHALRLGALEVSQLEIDVPLIEAAEWTILDRLIDEQRGARGSKPDAGPLVTGVYAIQGVAAGRWLSEITDQARIRLGGEALTLLDPATGAPLAAIPYASIYACTIERCDPADDFLLVASRTAVILRQAGVAVRHMVAHDPQFAALGLKLESRTAVAVQQFSGIPGRPEGLPTALRLAGEALHADWGLGTAQLRMAEVTPRAVEREADRLRLRVGQPGREWTATGTAAQLLPLAQSLEEAALPGELARESLPALYRRWQRRRLELLLWGILGDIARLDRALAILTEASTSAALADGPAGAAQCDLLTASLDNLKAKLALTQLSLPYGIARDDERFLAQLGDVTAPLRVRSDRYVERAVKAIVRSPLAHLQSALAEIENNLRARDDLRQVRRPGKLTLGFDASYCATVATALGASVFGPLGAVAGAALSGLKLTQENHSHTELQESLIRDYEANALTWWRHLCDRVLPLLVRDLTTECDRLSRSLAPRDRQIYARLAAAEPAAAAAGFHAALAAMLRAHARFRWGSPGYEAGEELTAGEILDRLAAAPPPDAVFSGLFPWPTLPPPAAPAEC